MSRLHDPFKKASPSRLFERIPSQEYLVECTEALLKEPTEEVATSPHSLLVFRLGEELLAIATLFVKEVAMKRMAHRIPHRSGKALLGLVNLNGELEICISLSYLLGIEDNLKKSAESHYQHQERMIAIVKDSVLWVFPVDEVMGIHYWDFAEMENLPINLTKSSVSYFKGILKWGNACIGVLDEELLFPSIVRNLS